MDFNGSIFGMLADIAGLSLFSGLRDNPLLASLRTLLEDLTGDHDDDTPVFDDSAGALDIIQDWANFTGAFVICQRDYSFYLTIAWTALADDNPWTQALENSGSVAPVLGAMAKSDLGRLGRIACFDFRGLGFYIADLLRKSGLEENALSVEEESRVFWAASRPGAVLRQSDHPAERDLSFGADLLLRIFPEGSNWASSIPAITDYIRTFGAGLLGQHDSFFWAFSAPMPSPSGGQGGWFSPVPGASGGIPSFLLSSALRPAANPDPVTLDDLFGYEPQRSVVVENTFQFISGRPANNLLLYGDRGTGKSATVKAVCHEFAHRGLKLVELDKDDLQELPLIMSLLSARSQYFVLFVDDLSFEHTDDSFRAFKALLEGGIETRPSNVVLYVTGNRRHLVKEPAADRSGSLAQGDVRSFDTMQEQLSLADRFGLCVIFSAPSQDEYLQIAEGIAEKRGIFTRSGTQADQNGPSAKQKFRENALRWEKWFNGRSPRTAVQYVDWISGAPEAPARGPSRKFPWE